VGQIHTGTFPDIHERVHDAVHGLVVHIVDIHIGEDYPLFELQRRTKYCERVFPPIHRKFVVPRMS